MLKTGLMIAGLVAGVSAPLEAEERNRKRHQHPPGWRVQVSSEPILARQGLYGFHVTVRDEKGRPVDDAEVFLQLHSFKAPGYRLVPASRVRRGHYRGTGQIKQGLESERHVRAVLRPRAER